jgi:hypothetical protein
MKYYLWTRDGIEVALVRTPDLTLIIICGKKICNNNFKSASYEGLFYFNSEAKIRTQPTVSLKFIGPKFFLSLPTSAGLTYGHTYLSVHKYSGYPVRKEEDIVRL